MFDFFIFVSVWLSNWVCCCNAVTVKHGFMDFIEASISNTPLVLAWDYLIAPGETSCCIFIRHGHFIISQALKARQRAVIKQDFSPLSMKRSKLDTSYQFNRNSNPLSYWWECQLEERIKVRAVECGGRWRLPLISIELFIYSATYPSSRPLSASSFFFFFFLGMRKIHPWHEMRLNFPGVFLCVMSYL